MKKYFGILAVSALLACNSSTNQSENKSDTTSATTDTLAVTEISFKDAKVQEIYSSYIVLKDALVASNFEVTKTASKALEEQLKTFKGCENTAVIVKKIENAKDLVEQRKDFTALNTDLIALFKNVELTAGTIFVQHCPMANSGDGGDWVSSIKKIQNPYYGDEMMECGAVIEEIKTK
jgi:hypothetical protein